MNYKGLELLHSFESCRLKAYPDPGPTGLPWTIGWGATGAGITEGTEWTQEQADARLADDLDKVEAGVRAILAITPDDDELDALVDFAYNEGLHKLNGSTLLNKINQGYDSGVVAAEFKKWIYAGGEVLEGLVARRAAEACLYASDYKGFYAILDARE
jgi:lysozyme